jgi:aquaporin Z
VADSTATTEPTEPTESSAPTIQQKLAAEVIGTFVLVLLGCGSVVYATELAGNTFPSTITTIGLTFGIAIVIMIYAFGRVSGGHFNPAVSFGAGVGGRMPWRDVWLYWLAQVVGAILGALVLFVLMHGFDGWDSEGNMGQNGFGDQSAGDYAWWAAFLLELVLTALFVFVILSVTDERNEHPGLAPLAIGLTLAAIHFVAIPATGTSVNPARSIGPALFAGGDSIAQLWLFIVAPLAGGLIAGLAYPMLFGRAVEDVPGSGLVFSRPRTATQAPGYAAPDQYQQQWGQEPVTSTQAQPAPIIQDGWQWDPVGQQWHPVGQTPEQWRAQQAAQEQAAREQAAREQAAQEQAAQEQAQQQAAQQTQQPPQEQTPQQPPWPPSDPDGGTQIRPPGQ